jgi:hypothetical protein
METERNDEIPGGRRAGKDGGKEWNEEMVARISAVSEQENVFRFVKIDLGLYFTTDGKFADQSGRVV